MKHKLIAEGRTATIHEWDDTYVVKLFRDWVDPAYIAYEARLGAFAASLTDLVPSFGGVVDVNGKQGLLYARVDGENLWVYAHRQQWDVPALAQDLAKLQFDIHQLPLPLEHPVPTIQDRLHKEIMEVDLLSEEKRGQLAETLATLTGNVLLHGDFHPANVMKTSAGLMVIDWPNALIGPPVAEVARLDIIFYGHNINDDKPDWQKQGELSFFRTYRDTYFELADLNQADYEQWLPIMAAQRLHEGFPNQEAWLLDVIERYS